MKIGPHRIVVPVEALLRQCDTLEAQSRQTRSLGIFLRAESAQ